MITLDQSLNISILYITLILQVVEIILVALFVQALNYLIAFEKLTHNHFINQFVTARKYICFIKRS